MTASELEAGELEIQVQHAPAQPPHWTQVSPVPAAVPAAASARSVARAPRSNHSQTPPSLLSSQGNLTLASRRRRAPTYSFVVQQLAKHKLRTPLPRLRGRGLGTTQCACADRPAGLKEEGGGGAPGRITWTAAGKGHSVRSALSLGIHRCPGGRALGSREGFVTWAGRCP